MHDQAIESRTRLQLEKATEEQAQELEDFKLDRHLAREGKQRSDRAAQLDLEIELQRKRQEAELRAEEARGTLRRSQAELDTEQEDAAKGVQDARQREHLQALKDLGVDLTKFLTQARADRVIEVRGAHDGDTHLHLAGTGEGAD